MREIKTRDLYNFRSRSYWLRRLENYGRKERVPVDEYTIEHILPQNENLSQPWSDALGPNWKTIQEAWLHTLGNLTLTGYNAEYSDRPFSEKRDMSGGFRHSPLRLNEGLGEVEVWDEAAIKARADLLSGLAAKVWRIPELSEDVLETFKRKSEHHQTYSIDDHPYLTSGPVDKLFRAFRKEVMSLDPCVTEEFLKYYVAYKAETNFVDAVPQAKRLRLSLNMKYHEVHDPKGLTRDITNIGRWGNGDVEVGLRSINELPYVMGLVRQAFEKQMGNGNEV
jgi:predicted transport protein